MEKLSFFAAVQYSDDIRPWNNDDRFRSLGNSFLESVDSFFFLGGKKWRVVHKTRRGVEKMAFSEAQTSLINKICKVVLYCTIFVPLVMLIFKAVLRAQHTFRVIDPRKRLVKGVVITPAIRQKITELLPQILGEKENPDIHWLTRARDTFVFQLRSVPDLVFKIDRPLNIDENRLPLYMVPERTSARFENMVMAKSVCLAHRLYLLVVPHAQKFSVKAEGNTYTFIAEKKLEFKPGVGAQRELYHQHADKLSETLQQLAIFVAKTKYNDVEFRNNPILDEPFFQSPRRIGLIDLEDMKSAVGGFTGDPNKGSRGLLRCVPENALESVQHIARRCGVVAGAEHLFQQAEATRRRELWEEDELRRFYSTHNVRDGLEPIVVDPNRLELPLEETVAEPGIKDPVTLAQAVLKVVEEINERIANNAHEDTIQEKRYVFLNKYKKHLDTYNSHGWLKSIIDELAKKKYLFAREAHAAGYYLQA